MEHSLDSWSSKAAVHDARNDNGGEQQQQQTNKAKPLLESNNNGQVRMSPFLMVVVLALSASLSYSMGRLCQSRFPSLRYTLLQARVIPLVSSPPHSHPLLSQDIKVDYSVIHDPYALAPGADHLLVDITHVDAEFLRSPDRLEAAFTSLFQQDHLKDQKLAMTHSDRLDEQGGGIMFTALFLQSHVFLHAWPSIGVVTIDIYKSRGTAWTTDESDVEVDHDGDHDDDDGDDEDEDDDDEEVSLAALIPLIEQFFAIGEEGKEPHLYWAIKSRGLDYTRIKSDPADTADYQWLYLGQRAYTHKELVTKVKTPFQTFEVFDLVYLRDEEQKRDRVLFLDHVIQSTRLGMEAYHEALVHPALITHHNPRRVAIVGGGEGETLREVLKHSTVEKAVMIEIDGTMMNASRTFLPEWNDCSDFVGSVGNCFDDPRAEVYATDAVAWFLDRYSDPNIPEEEKFDVIIMDALDPSSLIGFSDVLYGNLDLSQSMRNSLRDNGILIAQVGIADTSTDTGHQHNAESAATQKMLELFEQVGFQYSLDYIQPDCGFDAPWSFVIFFLDQGQANARWFANPAAIDLELAKRAIPTISGETPFHYFDGSTMATYQYPVRVSQIVWCRSFPNSLGCRDAEQSTAALGSSESTARTETTTKTCSVTDLQDEESVLSVSIMPSTAKLVRALSDTVSSIWKPIESAIGSYGFRHDFFGSTGYMINPSRTHDDDASDNPPYSLVHRMGNSLIPRHFYSILARANRACQPGIEDE